MGAERPLAIRHQLEKEIEGGFRYGFRTTYQISAGGDEFYGIEGCIGKSKLITCEYSQVLFELSTFSLQQEQMREISQPPQIPEREAGVARCESQLVIPLKTGSESIAEQSQEQQEQQQFEKEEN